VTPLRIRRQSDVRIGRRSVLGLDDDHLGVVTSAECQVDGVGEIRPKATRRDDDRIPWAGGWGARLGHGSWITQSRGGRADPWASIGPRGCRDALRFWGIPTGRPGPSGVGPRSAGRIVRSSTTSPSETGPDRLEIARIPRPLSCRVQDETGTRPRAPRTSPTLD
jgi:hypothetical protein